MTHNSMKTIPLLVALVSLAGCAQLPTQASNGQLPKMTQASAHIAQNKHNETIQLISSGQIEKAKALAEELVLADPKSATSHMLLGICYHAQGDAASLELASSGYNASSQFAGQDMWPHYLSGVVAMQKQNTQLALEHFSTAALAAPENAFVFEGLASAAYASGYLGLAEQAAHRALHLQPNSVIAWRMLALAQAAQGNEMQLQDTLKKQPLSTTAQQEYWLKTRTQNLLRTHYVDSYQRVAFNDEEQTSPAPIEINPATIDPAAPKQVTIDVTVILSDKRDTSRTGINLLDGLTGVFGYSYAQNGISTYQTGAANTDTTTRTITRNIRIPDVTYNLNIFNRGDRYYDAIARPSLTAFVGQPSRFFIGDQLNVNVAGIQSAQIEKIDVGISLKILPAEIRQDGTRFQLEVDRSFLSDTNAGTFTQAVGTFKQTLSATADVKFGETLILSGLTESVGDNSLSKTPVLGDIPGIKTLFSNKTTLKRARSAIILVTPSLPSSFAKTVNYSPATKKLLELWDKVIEPTVGSENLIKSISRMPQFTRFAHGDAQIRGLEDDNLKKALLESISSSTNI
jgi:tetratricopeptide (TPR) repeat protein